MKKYTLLLILLTLYIASTVKVDAITIFGKDLNFGKLFSNIQSGKPVSGVVDSKVNFEVTFPKKGADLNTGNIYNITWKTSDKTDSYNLILEGVKDINIGKAYNKGKTFSWLIPKDIKSGNYKLSFVDKYGNKYKSEGFKIKTAVEIQSYKIESTIGTPVSDKSYSNIDYKVTTRVAPAGEFNIKLTCPAGVSAIKGEATSDRCNKTITGNLFSNSILKPNEYNLTLPFTNKNKTAQLVTVELFVGGKSYGKIANMIVPTVTKPVSTFKFTYPTANQTLLLGRNYDIKWTGSDAGVDSYNVHVTGGGFGNNKDYGIGLITKAIASQGYYTFRVLTLLVPGERYQLVFSAPGVEDKRTEFFGVKNSINIPVLSKVSTTATTIKNNNVDVAVTENLKMNIQSQGGDILVSSVSAVIGLKNVATGAIIATTSVKGITETGLTYFTEGSIKPLDFTYTFASSTFPVGTTYVSAFVQSVTYKMVSATTSVTMTDGMDLFSGGSASFERRGVVTEKTPTIQAISSTAKVIRNNNNDNLDVGVNVNMRFNFTANGSDVYSINLGDQSKNMTAIIGLRNLNNGNVVIATSKPVNVITEEYGKSFWDGSTRQAEFNYIFATSSLPTGSTNVQAFLQSINYTPVNSATRKTITTGLGVFNTNSVTINVGVNTTILTRNLTLGSSGNDVLLLKRYLASAGYLNPSDPAASTNYFGNETLNAVKAFQVTNGISPANGYVGPVTRIKLNEKMIVIKES